MGAPMLMPMLIGAGVGAAGSLITGKDPLKGALLGGALGGGGAALGLGGATAAGASGGSGVAGATAASTVPMTTELGNIAAGTFATPTAESVGAGFGTGLTSGEVAGIPTAADIGAGFGSDKIAEMIAKDPSLFEKYGKYLTPQNMIGATQLASQFTPKPYQMSGGGGGAGISKNQFSPSKEQLSNVSLLTPQKRNNLFLLG